MKRLFPFAAMVTSLAGLLAGIVAAEFVHPGTLRAQPRLTLDYPGMAKRIVAQLALTPGEKVIAIAQAGVIADLLPHLHNDRTASSVVNARYVGVAHVSAA